MRRAYSGLSLLLGSEPFAGTEGRLVSGGESVCGDGVFVDRASVGLPGGLGDSLWWRSFVELGKRVHQPLGWHYHRLHGF